MGASLAWTLVAILTGCAFGTLFMAFHSTQGPQLGLPQMIQSRPQFGYMGALLVWVIALINYIGSNSLCQLFVDQTVHEFTGTSSKPYVVIFTILAILVAIFGYRWIHKVQRIISYIMIAVLAVFTVFVCCFHIFPTGSFSLSHFKTVAFLTEFFVAAAYQLSWAIYVSDYSRYLPPNVGVSSSFWWTYMGALIGGVWMMAVGALAAALFPKADIAEALLHTGNFLFPGFGAIVLIASFLGLITITGLNFYGGSLTLLSMIDSFKPFRPKTASRIITIIGIGIVCTFFAFDMTGNFTNDMGDFLTIILYLFTPWTAINLIDFYFVRHTHYSVREIFNPHGIYGRWSWRGLLAYGLGFVAMIPFFNAGFFIGPIAHALGGADISMVIGLIVSSGVYLLACRSLDLKAEFAAAKKADIGLDQATDSLSSEKSNLTTANI